jgi:hypothetical protein
LKNGSDVESDRISRAADIQRQTVYARGMTGNEAGGWDFRARPSS